MNGRIDIVVFPNGGREITGRISSEPEVPMKELATHINQFVASLQSSTFPRRFTGYYETPFTEISWQDYDSKNPIVLVDKKDLGIPYSSEDSEFPDVPYQFPQVETVSVEFSSLPSTVAEKYINN